MEPVSPFVPCKSVRRVDGPGVTITSRMRAGFLASAVLCSLPWASQVRLLLLPAGRRVLVRACRPDRKPMTPIRRRRYLAALVAAGAAPMLRARTSEVRRFIGCRIDRERRHPASVFGVGSRGEPREGFVPHAIRTNDSPQQPVAQRPAVRPHAGQESRGRGRRPWSSAPGRRPRRSCADPGSARVWTGC